MNKIVAVIHQIYLLQKQKYNLNNYLLQSIPQSMSDYQIQNQTNGQLLYIPKFYGRKTSDSWMDQDEEKISWEQEFPNLRFLKQLSTTESSSVWIVENCIDHKIYAAKIIPKIENQENDHPRQKEELRFLKQTKLKNMVTSEQIYSSIDFYLILMKYYKQGDLASYFQKNKSDMMLNQSEQSRIWLKSIFKQIVNAVDELHQNGYIHRDLKLSNFLMSDDHSIKLNDFGLLIKENQVDTSFCGTLAYMAPQRLDIKKSHNPISKASDMWSLGIILYELTTGEVPFDEIDRQQMLQSIYSNFIKLGDNVAKDVKDIIIKLLQINPQKRMTMGQLKVHSFLKND